jgi:hypothetical protein
VSGADKRRDAGSRVVKEVYRTPCDGISDQPSENAEVAIALVMTNNEQAFWLSIFTLRSRR